MRFAMNFSKKLRLAIIITGLFFFFPVINCCMSSNDPIQLYNRRHSSCIKEADLSMIQQN